MVLSVSQFAKRCFWIYTGVSNCKLWVLAIGVSLSLGRCPDSIITRCLATTVENLAQQDSIGVLCVPGVSWTTILIKTVVKRFVCNKIAKNCSNTINRRFTECVRLSLCSLEFPKHRIVNWGLSIRVFNVYWDFWLTYQYLPPSSFRHSSR